jgi:predicted secreted protein
MHSIKKNTLWMMISALVAVMAVGVLHAQQMTLLPEGQTLITLSVTERQKVAQDLLVAELRVDDEDRNAADLQHRINQQMAAALAITQAVAAVQTATGHYGVYQVNRQPQGARPDVIWRGSQSVTLQATDAAALLALAGELQAMGFVMNNLSYRLSNEKAEEVRDSLMETAISKARFKAESAARALGKTQVDVSALNVDGGYEFAQPVMMRAMAVMDAREMSAPVAAAGESEVSLTVSIQAVAR